MEYKMEIPLASFTLFPALPSELRLKIWKFALPEPRIIEICNASLFDSGDVVFKQVPCHCSAFIYPALATANIESRNLFLEHFTFCFGTHVSWKHDTIYIYKPYRTGSRDLDHLDREYQTVYESFARTVLASNGGKHLASLALGVHWLWTYWGRESGLPFFAPFSQLKELLLVQGTVGLLKPIDEDPGFE